MNSRSSKPLLIFLALIALSLAAVVALGILSVIKKNQEISRLAELSKQEADSRVVAQSIRAMRNAAALEIEAFKAIVLSDEKLVVMIGAIEEAGRAFGLETAILSVTETEEKSQAGVRLINLLVETKGSWAGTYSFLRSLESLPNRVVIGDSSIRGDESFWQSRFSISLYSFN